MVEMQIGQCKPHKTNKQKPTNQTSNKQINKQKTNKKSYLLIASSGTFPSPESQYVSTRWTVFSTHIPRSFKLNRNGFFQGDMTVSLIGIFLIFAFYLPFSRFEKLFCQKHISRYIHHKFGLLCISQPANISCETSVQALI